jgi:hypothetical protein
MNQSLSPALALSAVGLRKSSASARAPSRSSETRGSSCWRPVVALLSSHFDSTSSPAIERLNEFTQGKLTDPWLPDEPSARSR